ncbi:hypothetical protein U1Q18_038886, partial [Sarracenia purpurea var. burkii]
NGTEDAVRPVGSTCHWAGTPLMFPVYYLSARRTDFRGMSKCTQKTNEHVSRCDWSGTSVPGDRQLMEYRDQSSCTTAAPLVQ